MKIFLSFYDIIDLFTLKFCHFFFFTFDLCVSGFGIEKKSRSFGNIFFKLLL